MHFRSRETIAVLGQRIWQALAGLVTLVFVTYFVNPVTQGYFYTLSSLATLYMLLDMGLSTILVQFSANEFRGLVWNINGEIEGPTSSRFLALGRLSVRWYARSFGVLLLLCPLGYFLLKYRYNDPQLSWEGPWILLVTASAVSVIFIPLLSMVEGAGKLIEAYSVRLFQGIAGAITLWFVLSQGGALYGVAMSSVMGVVVGALWVIFWRKRMFIQIIREPVSDFHWFREVWPLQWRSSSSWLVGYALVLMHTPVLFFLRGPEVAGQMGITMTVVNMISVLAFSWITSHIPQMVRRASSYQWSELDAIFKRCAWPSMIAFVFGAILFMLIRTGLNWTPYGVRFLPIRETAILLVAMGFYHMSTLYGTYLRAHMQEPLVIPFLVGVGITSFSTVWGANHWGSMGIVLNLVAVNVLYFFPVSFGLWLHLKKKWHRENQ